MRMRYLLIVILGTLSGCGYTLQGGGSVLPTDVRRVAIPLAQNESTESGLGLMLTEALRDRFDRFGVITVVENTSEADAVLRTRILDVKRDTETVTAKTESQLQSSTTMTVAAELRRVTGPILWANPNMVVSKMYGTTSDVVVTSSSDFAEGSIGSQDLAGLSDREVSRGQERQALESLTEEVAKTVYDDAVAPDF